MRNLTNDKMFPIYFNDLKKETQKELLKAVNAKDPEDMNWDLDICPLCYYPVPYEEETGD